MFSVKITLTTTAWYLSIAGIFFFSLLVSCFNNSKPVNQTIPKKKTEEVQLGNSKYYLQLPNYLQLSEARGGEGQVGYNIIPKDSSVKVLGFIEIEHGYPIEVIAVTPADTTLLPSDTANIIRSSILNKTVSWKIDTTETGSFIASTPEKEVSARAVADHRSGIDSVIAVIATLTKK